MNLKQFNRDGTLRIVDKHGKEYIGPIVQYCYPDDNEGVDKESLIIENKIDGRCYNFYDHNIETIEFIDR